MVVPKSTSPQAAVEDVYIIVALIIAPARLLGLGVTGGKRRLFAEKHVLLRFTRLTRKTWEISLGRKAENEKLGTNRSHALPSHAFLSRETAAINKGTRHEPSFSLSIACFHPLPRCFLDAPSLPSSLPPVLAGSTWLHVEKLNDRWYAKKAVDFKLKSVESFFKKFRKTENRKKYSNCNTYRKQLSSE